MIVGGVSVVRRGPGGRRCLGYGMIAAMLVSALGAEPVAASELRTDMRVLTQLRRGDQSRDFEAPAILYGDVGLRGLPQRSSVDTYFGLAHDFSRNEGLFTDLYSASLHVPDAVRGVDFTVGRQFLAETPGGAFVADAGKVRFDLGQRESLTVFGGVPRYFEPTYSSEQFSQDENIWGGSVRTTRLDDTSLSLSYFNQAREGSTLRRLLSVSGATSRPGLPGLPNFYGSVSYDIDGANLDHAVLGTQVLALPPRLSLNFESSYYKPQDQGDYINADFERREDAIFELFSISDMLQFRGGLRYSLTSSMAAFADYSYQRYESLDGNYENGHVGSAGIDWLPNGDGLEVVRVEYYTADSGGGQVNGGRARYESRVYDRLMFYIGGGGAHFEKATNQTDFAINTITGIAYSILPGLVCELNFEANSNPRFDDDFRVGVWLTYDRRHQFTLPDVVPASGAQT